MGAIGLFQFLPNPGEHFGLSAQELLDVDKSADNDARYLAESFDTLKGDPVKEAPPTAANWTRRSDLIHRGRLPYAED